ncbi:MAG: hypothetical protein FWE74_04345 [Oscillospiraceae bacterium]|nr:hypothetical protein [Oscillospiraceae bacterium]
MAKKLLCVMLAMFMVLAFVGCNGADEPAPPVNGGGETPSDPADDPDPAGDPEIETPADPEGEKDEPQPDPIIFDNSGYTGPWPDFNDYVPFSYDMNRVVYATSFEDDSEICTCDMLEVACNFQNPGCDSIWKRRWDSERAINPMVGDTRINTTVMEHYGPQVLEISSDYAVHGNSSLLSDNMAHEWAGAILDLFDLLPDNETAYECFVWVKMSEDADPGRILLSREVRGLDGTEFGQWGDYDGDENLLSKYWLPAHLYVVNDDGSEKHPEEDGQSNIPLAHVNDDGWVLLRGTTQFVKLFYEEMYVYLETKGGHPNSQAIYMDCFTILLAE